MKYSDWQLNRLRDSLRAYHRYERSHEGEYFTWKDVSEAIDEYASVRVPPERLRQFVEGVNTKGGGRKFPVPQDKSLDGIACFVTVAELCLISEDELKEFIPDKQAALRLLEYLDQKIDAERIVPIEKIQGTYCARSLDKKAFTIWELTLQRPSGDGLMQVIETEDIYQHMASPVFDQWTPIDRKNYRDSHVKHGGWAILTPEDNLLFFLKDEATGRNRYYFTMALNLEHWSESPMTRLVLLHHDFPVELEDSDKNGQTIADLTESEMAKNLLVFERTSDQLADS